MMDYGFKDWYCKSRKVKVRLRFLRSNLLQCYGAGLGTRCESNVFTSRLCPANLHFPLRRSAGQLSEWRHRLDHGETSVGVKRVIVIHHGHGRMALWGLIWTKKMRKTLTFHTCLSYSSAGQKFWKNIQTLSAGLTPNAIASKIHGWFGWTRCDGKFQ